MASDKRNLARYLRSNMTLPEVLLWKHIQRDQLGVRFRRQYQFDRYILDFYCDNPKLAAEVDGQIHALQQERDLERDEFLLSSGVDVLRISARAILQFPDSAIAMIEERIRLLRKNDGEP